MALAIQRAESYWGVVPCGGTFDVQLIDTTPTGAKGWADTTYCHAYIDSVLFATPAQQAAQWPAFCQVVVHEIGHLILGLDYFKTTNPSDPAHSADQTNVMQDKTVVYPSSCFPAVMRVNGRYYKSEVRQRRILTSARRGRRLVGLTAVSDARIAKRWYQPQR